MPLWLFIFLGALSVISALGVVIQRNPVHSLLALIVTLMTIGVLFIGLGAVTVGFLQVIVYVGAILVLFLFVIWLLNLQSTPMDSGHLALKLLGALGAAALVAELFAFFVQTPLAPPAAKVASDYGSVLQLSNSLFSDYLIAFEVTSVLLLAAVVGAVALARRAPAEPESERAEPRAARSEGW
ncbi:MAG TPA: NADH-quinone oxidoreductase subunit J [Candidatus Binataceae bacterium]|nr:NADH-quinone oxidoreductase subunit J [Candidatus Binataceae bacterium]